MSSRGKGPEVDNCIETVQRSADRWRSPSQKAWNSASKEITNDASWVSNRGMICVGRCWTKLIRARTLSARQRDKRQNSCFDEQTSSMTEAMMTEKRGRVETFTVDPTTAVAEK